MFDTVNLDVLKQFPAWFVSIWPDCHLLWQLSLQVCAWLSHALTQGVLKVVGQTRLQESFWLAQLAKHASEVASANRSLFLTATS
jgi:hypothetical protein